MSASAVRRHVVVRGRVQGVAFRWSTQEAARRLGVCGWVRNLPDGSVEAVFEGAPAAVAEAEAYCASGPPAARVDALEARDEAPEGLREFAVR